VTQEDALVRLRTLGALDLTAEGRDSGLRRLLQQPKRLGLLVYLRLHASAGPVRRDTLLATFWPDLPQDRGRRALSQALYTLRKSLGDGLLDADGGDAVSVDPAGIWCDASRFEEALAEGNPEEALALYGGDLLAGFFVPDAPGFEHWADAERTRLKDLAAHAASALAEREEAAANLSGAARWARRRHASPRFRQPLSTAHRTSRRARAVAGGSRSSSPRS
jgi:DNA-binding SARP family transcriptional activator